MTESSGKIYKIINSIDKQVFIGTTVKPHLNSVISTYKYAATNRPNKTSRLFQHMRAIGVDKFSILLIKEYQSITKEKLVERGCKEMKNYNPKLILNMERVYQKRSKETGLKIAAARFRRGCLERFQGICTKGYDVDRITFVWRDYSGTTKRKRSKSWSVLKYGLNEAWSLGKAFRNTIYPL